MRGSCSRGPNASPPPSVARSSRSSDESVAAAHPASGCVGMRSRSPRRARCRCGWASRSSWPASRGAAASSTCVACRPPGTSSSRRPYAQPVRPPGVGTEMHVVATAGHVDHGKSTLVRALTGIEPDRWAEEHRRGLTIDLGYAWTTLPSGEQVAFVDVPGHQRFIGNMLAGLGPAPAVVMVVAADEGWRPQSAEHLAAVDALGISRGLVVVTRSDLADPRTALAEALAHVGRTSLAGSAALAVSARTGQGIEALRGAIDDLVASLPTPDRGGRTRLWVDRSFSVRGSGTVVTGTLGGGTIRLGDELVVHRTTGASQSVTVRGIQRLGRTRDEVPAVARVAVNLRGVGVDEVSRGDALLTPCAWHVTTALDARLVGAGDDEHDPAAAADSDSLPSHVMVHLGTLAVEARVR